MCDEAEIEVSAAILLSWRGRESATGEENTSHYLIGHISLLIPLSLCSYSTRLTSAPFLERFQLAACLCYAGG